MCLLNPFNHVHNKRVSPQLSFWRYLSNINAILSRYAVFWFCDKQLNSGTKEISFMTSTLLPDTYIAWYLDGVMRGDMLQQPRRHFQIHFGMRMCEFRLRFTGILFPRSNRQYSIIGSDNSLAPAEATSRYLNQWWSVYRCICETRCLNEFIGLTSRLKLEGKFSSAFKLKLYNRRKCSSLCNRRYGISYSNMCIWLS